MVQSIQIFYPQIAIKIQTIIRFRACSLCWIASCSCLIFSKSSGRESRLRYLSSASSKPTILQYFLFTPKTLKTSRSKPPWFWHVNITYMSCIVSILSFRSDCASWNSRSMSFFSREKSDCRITISSLCCFTSWSSRTLIWILTDNIYESKLKTVAVNVE